MWVVHHLRTLRLQWGWLTSSRDSENDSSILEAHPISDIHIIGLYTELLRAIAVASARSAAEVLKLVLILVGVTLQVAPNVD